MKVRAVKRSYTGNTVLRAQPSAQKPPCTSTLKSNTPPNVNRKTHSPDSTALRYFTKCVFHFILPPKLQGGGEENSQFATGCCRTLQTKPQAGRHFPADPCSISLLTRGLLGAQNRRPLKNTRSPRRPLFVAAATLVGGFWGVGASSSFPSRVAWQGKLLSETFHLRFIPTSQAGKITLNKINHMKIVPSCK